jgi:hypothetical protein
VFNHSHSPGTASAHVLASATGVGESGEADSMTASSVSKIDLLGEGVAFKLDAEDDAAPIEVFRWETVRDWTLLEVPNREMLQTVIRYIRPTDIKTQICGIVTDRRTAFWLAKEAKNFVAEDRFMNRWGAYLTTT